MKVYFLIFSLFFFYISSYIVISLHFFCVFVFCFGFFFPLPLRFIFLSPSL